MAPTESFSISKRGAEPIEVTRDLPQSVDDPIWAECVSNVEEDINTLARQALVVKMQAAGRQHIDQGEDAVQTAVSGYKFGARSGGFRRPSISGSTAAELQFSPEQLAALQAAGVQID